MTSRNDKHDALIIEQFSKQAIPFAQVPGHCDGIDLLVALAEPARTDVALDAACGPGLVACAFAAKVAHIEGIDFTPAMIDEARKRQETVGVDNVSWRVGSIDALPYANDSFDLVMTRYSFHHLRQPRHEPRRICRRLQLLRDWSHDERIKVPEILARGA